MRAAMRGLTLALACACVLALAGCGSSSSSGNSAARSTACARVVPASASYKAATRALSLRFFNKTLVNQSLAAIAGLQSATEKLARATTGAQHDQAVQFAGALARQKVTIAAVVAHDAATARKSSKGLNPALETGRTQLSRICPGA